MTDDTVDVSSVARRPIAARAQNPAMDLLHAALHHSVDAVAVCDGDLIVRFTNPAFDLLIDHGVGSIATDRSTGAALLGALGLGDVESALADATRLGIWRGCVGEATNGNRAASVAVERFGDADGGGGWLITAREQASPAIPPHATERALIMLSDKLTPREREIMLGLHAGATNKAIAIDLKISPRTVEFHRAKMMQRFAATSLVDLVRKVAVSVLAVSPLLDQDMPLSDCGKT